MRSITYVITDRVGIHARPTSRRSLFTKGKNRLMQRN